MGDGRWEAVVYHVELSTLGVDDGRGGRHVDCCLTGFGLLGKLVSQSSRYVCHLRASHTFEVSDVIVVAPSKLSCEGRQEN